MTKEFYDHIENNLPTFNMWIETHSRLQISNDIFLPLIPVFMEHNPTVNLNACQDCIIDMLIWCRMKLKEKRIPDISLDNLQVHEDFAHKLDKTTAKIEKKHKAKKKP